jgi:hypothetical protein
MLKCLLAALACALLLQNVSASESHQMGKKSNRVNLLSRAVGARMLAGTTPDNFASQQTNSFGAMGTTPGMTGTGTQFVPIARSNVAQIQTNQQTTSFDTSQLTPDQFQQLQRFMTSQVQQTSGLHQPQQQQQMTQTATIATPVMQTVTKPTFDTSMQMQQIPQTQTQTGQANVGTGIEQQLLEQQKMTQKLQEQLKAFQQLQTQQKLNEQQTLAQQLQQFESVQRGGQQPQGNQMPATQLAKSNEQPQRVTFQQGSSRITMPTTQQTMPTMNTMQQTPQTTNTMQQTVPSMNTAQQNMQSIPTGAQMQQQVPTTQQQQQQVPTNQQQQQFQTVQQIPALQKQTVPVQHTTVGAVREDICATAQPGELFPHPSDPTQFVICYGFGEFTVMDCPDMLVYNDHMKRCDVNTEVPLLCKSNPCLNNGKCSETNSVSFKCECPTGFGGQFCEKLDTCSTRPCGTDGVCIPFVLGSPVAHVCLCNGGRTVGINCQKVEQNPCLTPGSNLRLLSVSFNPSVFAHCEGSRPHFKFCQPPLIFSNAKQTCEWA